MTEHDLENAEEGDSPDIRSVHLSQDDKDAAAAIGAMQDKTPSDVLRAIFDLFLEDKLNVVVDKPAKTSLWISPEKWMAVRDKCKADGVPVRAVVAAGIRRLTTGR